MKRFPPCDNLLIHNCLYTKQKDKQFFSVQTSNTRLKCDRVNENQACGHKVYIT